ncbi:hypothetical protein [Corynebacterium sphenisci]|uniref:hypothetical protein n=1 Tax=Corynebacterium sphenisci TaxID=191493 RepID=UPI0026E0B8D9|nr:hypothetical protein [Corynebacterium sphenisci]MDO5730711.1 hypothetical protein [Corynebacterium sphenisci]
MSPQRRPAGPDPDETPEPPAPAELAPLLEHSRRALEDYRPADADRAAAVFARRHWGRALPAGADPATAVEFHRLRHTVAAELALDAEAVAALGDWLAAARSAGRADQELLARATGVATAVAAASATGVAFPELAQLANRILTGGGGGFSPAVARAALSLAEAAVGNGRTDLARGLVTWVRTTPAAGPLADELAVLDARVLLEERAPAARAEAARRCTEVRAAPAGDPAAADLAAARVLVRLHEEDGDLAAQIRELEAVARGCAAAGLDLTGVRALRLLTARHLEAGDYAEVLRWGAAGLNRSRGLPDNGWSLDIGLILALTHLRLGNPVEALARARRVIGSSRAPHLAARHDDAHLLAATAAERRGEPARGARLLIRDAAHLRDLGAAAAAARRLRLAARMLAPAAGEPAAATVAETLRDRFGPAPDAVADGDVPGALLARAHALQEDPAEEPAWRADSAHARLLAGRLEEAIRDAGAAAEGYRAAGAPAAAAEVQLVAVLAELQRGDPAAARARGAAIIASLGEAGADHPVRRRLAELLGAPGAAGGPAGD